MFKAAVSSQSTREIPHSDSSLVSSGMSAQVPFSRPRAGCMANASAAWCDTAGMDTFEITLCGYTFTVTDAKGEAHARAAVAALEHRMAELRESTGVVQPLRVALMA